MKAIWIDSDMKDTAERSKYIVSDCATVIAVHLTELIKKYAAELLGRQEVKQIVDKFKNDYPAVVEELNNEKISNGDIQKVLHNLLRERVSIKNMLTIMETMATYSKLKDDPNMLTEYVRVALSRQITQDYIDKESPDSLYVITVDSEIEAMIRGAIYEDPMEGRIVALDPQSHGAILSAMKGAYNKAVNLGYSPIFLVSPHIRSLVLTLLERDIALPVVLSYNEINSGLKVNVVASALLPDAA
jgi:flagellar biosynthesis protein FlhA